MNTAFPRLSPHHETKKDREKGSPQSALDERSAGWWLTKLEVQLQSELDLPRVVRSITGGSNLAEGRTIELTRVGNCYNAVTAEIRSVEVRVVENIEDLRPELEAEPLAQSNVLESGEIQPVESRSWNLRDAAQGGSTCQRNASGGRIGLRNATGAQDTRLSECSGIAVPTQVPTGVSVQPKAKWLSGIEITATQRGRSSAGTAEANRLATLQRGAPVYAPASYELIHSACAARSETLALTERQLVATAEMKYVPEVEIRQAIVECHAETGNTRCAVTCHAPSVEQVTRVCHRLGVCVGKQEV
jgi:hypothetical protein